MQGFLIIADLRKFLIIIDLHCYIRETQIALPSESLALPSESLALPSESLTLPSESLEEDSEEPRNQIFIIFIIQHRYQKFMATHILHMDKFEFYFCTITCYNWLPLFEITNFYDFIYKWFDRLKSEKCYVAGYVIMPNHLHALFFIADSKRSLNTIIGEGKRFMAYEIVKRLETSKCYDMLNALSRKIDPNEIQKGKKHNIFQPSFDAKKCYSVKIIVQKLEYMHNNPMKGIWSIVDNPLDYAHSSASFYQNIPFSSESSSSDSEGKAYDVVHYEDLIDGKIVL